MRSSSIGVPVQLVLATALIAACSGSPATTQAPPATPTGTPMPTSAPPTAAPSPSPTAPADVATLFASQLTDPAFEGTGPISGTLSLGNVEGTVTGALGVKGADSGFQLAIEIPNLLATSTYQIKVDGRKYVSQDGGPWFEVEDPSGSSGLSAAMDVAALTVTDAGIVTRGGQSLHHLVPANGGSVTAADLGMTDPSMADARGTLEFYARDDGSLAVMSMSLSWTATSGNTSIPATMALDFTFNQGDLAVIQPPDQVWTRYTSTRFAYSIGYPVEWQLYQAESDSDWDVFAYSASQYTAVARDVLPKSASGNLDAYVKAYIALEKQTSKAKPETNRATTVLGLDGRRLTYHRVVNGNDLYSIHTLLVRGRNAYQISTFGPTGYEQALDDLHQVQLTTMTLEG